MGLNTCIQWLQFVLLSVIPWDHVLARFDLFLLRPYLHLPPGAVYASWKCPRCLQIPSFWSERAVLRRQLVFPHPNEQLSVSRELEFKWKGIIDSIYINCVLQFFRSCIWYKTYVCSRSAFSSFCLICFLVVTQRSFLTPGTSHTFDRCFNRCFTDWSMLFFSWNFDTIVRSSASAECAIVQR